jgi:DNA-binding NarL/FixJ family response regulator
MRSSGRWRTRLAGISTAFEFLKGVMRSERVSGFSLIRARTARPRLFVTLSACARRDPLRGTIMTDIRVLLADDHAVVRAGLKALIDTERGLKVVGEASNGHDALALLTERNPDVVVLDVSMPGMSGAQLAARIRQSRPDQKILALTVHEERGYLRELLAAGAAGYVLKRAAAAELIRAIRAVADGGTYIDPVLAASVIDTSVRPPTTEPEAADLSEREAEVVRQIARGYSNKEIAARLGLSVKTIETYKTRSMEKLQTRSRVELVKFAARRGWLTDEPA